MRPMTAAGLLAGLIACLGGAAQAGPKRAPSLEGMWFVNALLPLEATPRTPSLVVPEAESKVISVAVAKELSVTFEQMLDPEFPQLAHNADGLAVVRGERRTRAVVLPADGRLPYTAAARKEAETPPPDAPLANPEDRPGAERCLTGSGQPPTYFTLDAQTQILVLKDQVVFLSEYGADLRVVPITDRHGPKALYGRNGDSIGRWEGRTLVIETVGMPDADRDRFYPVLVVPGSATVIERLTPISDRELLYQFTVVDPSAYAAPWLGELSWRRTDKPMYEHACHEGNYALPNILAGARYEEAHARPAAAAAPPKAVTR